MLCLVYLVVALCSGLFFYYILPQQYYAIFPGISLFFGISGLLLNWRLSRVRMTDPDRLFNVFMVGRMWKFVATLAFLFLYVIFDKENKVVFGISLMLNYILYSALEIYILYLYHKRIHRHANKNKK